MTSFVPTSRAHAGHLLLDQLNEGHEGPPKTVELRISQSEVRVRLDPVELGPDTEAIVRHMTRRAAARIEDDMLALVRGEPMRHELKPAKARRVR